MNTPSPVLLSQAWSPVGYEVIELAPAGTSPPFVKQRPVHRSPVGYRVVVVAEEQVPVRLRAAVPKPRWSKLGRPKNNRTILWSSLLGAGFFVVIVVLTLTSTFVLWTATPRNAQGPLEVVIPEELALLVEPVADKPAANAVAQEKIQMPLKLDQLANGDELQCEACQAPEDQAFKEFFAKKEDVRPDREAFGTAVEFVRNAQEAARLAKEERKLTFLLHVAGNFEEPGFT